MKKLLLGAAVAGGAAFGLRRLARHAHSLCEHCGTSVARCCHSEPSSDTSDRDTGRATAPAHCCDRAARQQSQNRSCHAAR